MFQRTEHDVRVVVHSCDFFELVVFQIECLVFTSLPRLNMDSIRKVSVSPIGLHPEVLLPGCDLCRTGLHH